MAIPGSPLDPRSAGCNQLIRDGAVLVSEPQDVIELLETFTGAPRSTYRVAEDATKFDYAELSKLEWGEAKASGDEAEAIAQAAAPRRPSLCSTNLSANRVQRLPWCIWCSSIWSLPWGVGAP